MVPNWKYFKVCTHFWTDSTYENELLTELPLTQNDLSNTEMEYHGKFEHTIGSIQHIYIMIRIGIFYTA